MKRHARHRPDLRQALESETRNTLRVRLRVGRGWEASAYGQQQPYIEVTDSGRSATQWTLNWTGGPSVGELISLAEPVIAPKSELVGGNAIVRPCAPDSGYTDAFKPSRYLLARLDACAVASHSRMQTSRSET